MVAVYKGLDFTGQIFSHWVYNLNRKEIVSKTKTVDLQNDNFAVMMMIVWLETSAAATAAVASTCALHGCTFSWMVGIVGHEGDECRQHDDDGLGLEQLVSNSRNAMLYFLLIILTYTHRKRMLVLGNKPTATSAMM
jgi:hypothetical protein